MSALAGFFAGQLLSWLLPLGIFGVVVFWFVVAERRMRRRR